MRRDNELRAWKMKHLAIGFDALGAAADPVLHQAGRFLINIRKA